MKFSVRLSIIGLVFIVMFSVVGLRLWFVQIAEGPAIAQAAENQTWLHKVSYAPRGDIYDRNGVLLATSRMVPAVFVDRTFVDPDEREELIQRLSAILGIDAEQLDAMYEEAGINGRFKVAAVPTDLAYQINEQLEELPGVEIAKAPQRVYLSGPTLAHVVGYLGSVGEEDLEKRPDLDPNLRIGKLGVEGYYDELLQGASGVLEYRVYRGEIIDQKPPVEPEQGSSLMLSVDLQLQELVERALEQGIELSNSIKDERRAEGDEEVFNVTESAAAVVLDAQTFEVLAMASVPDFDPQLFDPGISDEQWDELQRIKALSNLAITAAPPASTFKAITYTVFQEEDLPLPEGIEGVDVENRLVNCDGQLELPDLADGSAQVKKDWYYKRFDFGWKDVDGALEVSCNIFFWNVGLGTWRAFKETPRENILQDWAKRLGYGVPTGVDLVGEADGQVPTRELFEELAEEQRATGKVLLHPSRLEQPSPWLGGDLMDFAIGQGFFTATPLQVAVSYAAVVNGGMVKEPRVARGVVAPTGELVEEFTAPVVRLVSISEETRRGLLDGLNAVVNINAGTPDRGTAWRAFENFGPGIDNVGGKTGTSQLSKTEDPHAWFVGVAPLDNPRYIVVVFIKNGGSGGAVAAPVARHILQYLMGNEPTPIVAGEVAD